MSVSADAARAAIMHYSQRLQAADFELASAKGKIAELETELAEALKPKSRKRKPPQEPQQ